MLKRGNRELAGLAWGKKRLYFAKRGETVNKPPIRYSLNSAKSFLKMPMGTRRGVVLRGIPGKNRSRAGEKEVHKKW